MKFYLNGKKISKQEAATKAGSMRFETIIKEAKETYADDPYTEISYMVSSGFLNIEF